MQSASLLLTAPGRLEWVVDELSPLAPGDVLIRTTASAVSVGTELPQYRGDEREIVSRGYPRMTGYESLGVVAGCGSDVRHLATGQRVVAFYGHRTYGIVAEANAIPMPDDVPDTLALLAILSCDAAKGVRALAPAPDDPVLVTGAGTMGLLALFVLSRYGVHAVDVVEPRPERRALARRLGAHQCWAPDEMPTTTTYAVGIECSSRDAAFTLLQEHMRPGGRICVLADGNIEPLTLVPAFHVNELAVVASSNGWDYQRHATWYVEQVRHNTASQLEQLFDLKVGSDELPAVFERMARGEIAPVKVLVRYREDERT